MSNPRQATLVTHSPSGHSEHPSYVRFVGLLLLVFALIQLFVILVVLPNRGLFDVLWPLLEGASGGLLLIRPAKRPRYLMASIPILAGPLLVAGLWQLGSEVTLTVIARLTELVAVIVLFRLGTRQVKGFQVAPAMLVASGAIVLLGAVFIQVLPTLRLLNEVQTDDGWLRLFIAEFDSGDRGDVFVSDVFGSLTVPDGWTTLKIADSDWEEMDFAKLAAQYGHGKPTAILGHQDPAALAFAYGRSSGEIQHTPDLESILEEVLLPFFAEACPTISSNRWVTARAGADWQVVEVTCEEVDSGGDFYLLMSGWRYPDGTDGRIEQSVVLGGFGAPAAREALRRLLSENSE